MFCRDDLASMISVELQRAKKLRAGRGSFTIKPCSGQHQGHTCRSRGHGIRPKALFVSDQVSEHAEDERKSRQVCKTLCAESCIAECLSSNRSLVERLSLKLSIEKELRCNMQECNDS